MTSNINPLAKIWKRLLASTVAGEKLFEAGLLTAMRQERLTRWVTAFNIRDTPGISLLNKQNTHTSVEGWVSKASSTEVKASWTEDQFMEY